MTDPLNILLVDDHPIFLKGLVEVIQDEFPTFIIESFNSSPKALDHAKQTKYDIAILDLDMPVLTGIELGAELKVLQPELVIIILTMHKEHDVMRSVLAKGIDGYVLKDDVVDELVVAIGEVLKGNIYISELETYAVPAGENQELRSLTKTELIVLKGISEHKTSKELASELFISLKTVENHRNNISRKLRLQGSNSLLKFAISNKHLL